MLTFVICVIAVFLFWRWVIDGGNSGPPTLGKETTAVSDAQYVREDGSISYVRAVNDWRSEGVTAENNACVDLMRAVGPTSFDPAVWPLAWAAAAGREAKLPTGPFLTAAPWTTPEEMDQYDQSMERPWRDDEFPQLFKYVQANQACLDHAVAGSKKDHFYFPLIIADRADVSLIEVLLPIAQGSRNIVRGLKMRAMNHLANGRNQPCLDDLLAARRIGNLVSQKGLLIDHLVGTAIVHMAIVAEMEVIESGQLTPAEVNGYLAQLKSLPEFNNLTESVDIGERLASLDAIQSIRYGDSDQLDAMAMWSGSSGPTDQFMSNSFDLDEAMKIMNLLYDEQVQITRAPTFAEQVRLAAEAEETLTDLAASSNSVAVGIQSWVGGNRSRGKMMGNVLASLMLPSVSQVCHADTRRVAMDRMAYLAFRLEQYRFQNGNYPESLAALQLGSNSRLTDPYSDRPIHYTRQDGGFQLHVVGRNMQDDQGVGLEESDGVDTFGDDWKIEIDRSKTADNKTGE